MKRLNDLLVEELADLLNAENQLVEALPKMARASQSSELKTTLENYWKLTREHINQLQDIFGNIGQNPSQHTCKAMTGFIADSEDILSDPQRYPARDTALIKVMQRVENYEIDKYKIANEHAANLGHTKIVDLLDKIIDEERAMNLHLNELAQRMINHQATASSTPESGFYIVDEKFNRSIQKKPKNMEVSRFINEGNPNIQEPPQGV